MELFEDEKEDNVYLVYEHEGKKYHQLIFTAYSEIEAFKKYNEIKTKDKSIYRCNTEFKNVLGVKVYSKIDKLEKIK